MSTAPRSRTPRLRSSRLRSSRLRTGALAALVSSALVAGGSLASTAANAAPAAPSVSTLAATPTSTPARLGMPGSIAVLGDSISQGTGANDGGASSGGQSGGIGSPRLRNSWATGDWPGLGSYLQRTRSLPGGSGTVGINLSANGANMRNNFLNQARSVPAGTGLVLIQMGGNDLCRPSEGEMTSVADYRTQLRAGLQWLQDNRPDTLVMAYSVPDIYNLWYLRGAAHQGEKFGIWPFRSTAAGPRPTRGSQDNGTFWARQFWDGLFGSVIPCKSLLVDPTNPRNAVPTPTPTHATEARRLRVRERTQAFNTVLQQECNTMLRCRFDNNAIFDFASNRINGSLTGNTSLWRFVDRDISTQDHFHPSYSGQQKLGAEAFGSGYNFTDRTPPTVAVATTTSANAAGWHRSNVTVQTSAADSAGVRGFEHRIHGVDGSIGPWQRTVGSTGPRPIVSAEGISHVEVRALDVNGNLSASTILTVRIDKTLPQTEPVIPAEGATFEQHEQVRAAYTCSDAGGSDLTRCAGTVTSGALIDTSTVGEKSFTITATDAAGNVRRTTRTYTVQPATAGVRTDSSTASTGTHRTAAGATERIGSPAGPKQRPVVRDDATPTVSVTVPADGARYEHGDKVLAAYVCADAKGGSGVAPGYCEGTVDAGVPINTTTLGTHTFEVTATDRAGNSTTTSVSYEVVDATAPTISSPHEGIEYKLGQPVEALFTCTDEDGGSSVATCDGPDRLDTASIGAKSFDVVATDAAGNTRTETVTYRVIYAYGEVKEPISKDGTSVFKAGSTVPVRFQLTDYDERGVGGATVTLGTISTYDIEGTVDPMEMERVPSTSGSANSGNLFRSSSGGQYAYNLSTKGMAPGSYMLYIRLDDGKQYTAVFTLR
ncbi:MAG TPA: SGNH/GDSL hydrolase family protein [Intrasporangiaceae bacterium]|nr:SGNH/GDSL hydrolase family protein [Intrasporangiaceae bacterium]